MKSKLRNFNKILISILMMTVFVLVGTKSNAVEQELSFNASAAGPIYFDGGSIGNWFCREHGKPAVFRDEAGNVISNTTYKLIGEKDFNQAPMSAYAYYKLKVDGYNSSDAQKIKHDMQKLFWSEYYISSLFNFDVPSTVEEDSEVAGWLESASIIDTTDMNENGIPDNEEPDFDEQAHNKYLEDDSSTYEKSDLLHRAQDYGRVEYAIFKRLKDPKCMWVSDTKEEDLMVLVDQVDKTYTVGPYTLNLNIDKASNEGLSDEAKKEFTTAESILYNELTSYKKDDGTIVSGNTGWTDENKFAYREAIEDMFGKDAILVDKDGKEILWPNFDQDNLMEGRTEQFFVRFKPDNDGQIFECGHPNLKIQYINDFSGKIYRYQLQEVEGDVKIGETKTLEGKKSLKDYAYEAFEEWYQDNITVAHDSTSSDSDSSDFTAYVNGTLTFSNLKIYIYAGKSNKKYIEKTLPDFSIVFDRGNNKDSDSQNGVSGYAVHHKKNQNIPNDSDYYYWNSSKPGKDKFDLDSLKKQCEKVIDNTTVHYEFFEAENDDQTDIGEVVQKCSLTVDSKTPSKKNDNFTLIDVTPTWVESETGTDVLPSKKVDEMLGGKVWLEGDGIKADSEHKSDGRYNSAQDTLLYGVQVELHEIDLDGGNDHLFKYDGVTNPMTTDSKGEYVFEHLNPLKKYYVVFTYNGQYYQSTYYKYNIAAEGGYSNARELHDSEQGKDIVTRETVNARFTTIDSTHNSYQGLEGWNEAYGKDSRLMKDNGDFISYTRDYGIPYTSDNQGALTFYDAVEIFRKDAMSTDGRQFNDDGTSNGVKKTNYEEAYNKLRTDLAGLGVGSQEIDRVIKFMKDCDIKSTTYVEDSLNHFNSKGECGNQKKVVYPVYNQFILEDQKHPENVPHEGFPNPTTMFNLAGGALIGGTGSDKDKVNYYYVYTKDSDQSRYVDFGLDLRIVDNLLLFKDVTKATLYLNGQKHEYYYGEQGEIGKQGVWTVKERASDVLYNGEHAYKNFIRRSDILFDAGSTYGNEFGDLQDQLNKNLDLLLTYQITVVNSGNTNMTVDEIVDYYDADQFVFDGTLNGDTYTPTVYTDYAKDGSGNGTQYINTYQINLDNGTNLSSDNTKTNLVIKTNSSQPNRENSHVTLTGDHYKYESLYITGLEGSVLAPNQYLAFYITFKCNKDNAIEMLDQDVTSGKEKVGKKNIAEINGYTNNYADGTQIPNILGDDDGTQNRDAGKISGLVDVNSKAGSLASWDLMDDEENAGKIKVGDTTKYDPLNNRFEDDTCQAPPFKLLITTDTPREVQGYTFEDTRSEDSEKAKIGNGKFGDNDDKKVNGVTVELVELVRKVDSLNQFKGEYVGEHVWYSQTVSLDHKATNNGADDDYYSGIDHAKIIINGPEGTILHSDGKSLNGGQGEYSFISLPAGDFFVRFKYGDSTRTVLVNDENSDVNKFLGTSGMNATSYNGNDYKSTVYQKGVSQDGNYFGIQGYTNSDDVIEKRNYTNTDENTINGTNGSGPFKNGADLDKMYLYNIVSATENKDVSDAKDVYYYRNRANEYSTTMLNNKAEILASPYKVAMNDSEEITKLYDGQTTGDSNLQKDLVNQLMQNTYMVAQTGIIDFELEWNSDKTTDSAQSESANKYVMEDVDLGLVERPEAGLKLNKKVSNFEVTLSNGETLFNTNQSVNNLYFANHAGHISGYKNNRMNEPKVNPKNTNKSPEIIQAYMDDEILSGSNVKVTYEYKLTNIGEVDYKDKRFYYLGEEKDKGNNIVKTSAPEVVDYLTNGLKYEESFNQSAKWNVTSKEIIFPSVNKDNGSIDTTKVANDLVNNIFYKNAKTYNTILITTNLEKNGKGNLLVPELFNKDESYATTQLVGSTLLSGDANADDLVYNNIAEVIHVNNDVGRRLQYSIVGNQPMSDQNLGSDTDNKYKTSVDLITPTEVDADSAQMIRILPPTGQNKQYLPIIFVSIGAVVIIGLAIIIIRKKVLGTGKGK